MKFPLWKEVVKKISEFQNQSSKKIQQFKGNYPLADAAIKTAISVLLPPPLNILAENVYNSSPGSPKEKNFQVIEFLQQIQQQGESQYNTLVTKLEDTLSQIGDVKTAMAKESTIVKLTAVLIGGQEEINQKLNELSNDVKELTVKVSGEINSLSKYFRGSDRILSETTGESFKGLADQQGNEIQLKYYDQIETITGADLDRLDDGAKRIIKTYERSMENAETKWGQVKPEIVKQIDPVVKAKMRLELKEVLDQICHDMQDIFEYLLSLNKKLMDHYVNYRHLCDKAKSQIDTL